MPELTDLEREVLRDALSEYVAECDERRRRARAGNGFPDETNRWARRRDIARDLIGRI